MNTVEVSHNKIVRSLDELEKNEELKDNAHLLRIDYMANVLGPTSGDRNPANYYRELDRMDIIARLNKLLNDNEQRRLNIRSIPQASLQDNCEICGVLLELTEAELVCPRCNLVRENLITPTAAAGNKDDKKHYDNKMDVLFGRIKKPIAADVLAQIRQYIQKHRVDLRKSNNYAYRVRNILKVLKIRGHNTLVTKIIKECWGIDIPALSYSEEQRHKYLFTKLDEAQKVVFPNGYRINYSFTDYKIFHCGFPWDERIQEICKFIYIQETKTFKKHDRMLKQLIDHLDRTGEHLFVYRDTPHNIYLTRH